MIEVTAFLVVGLLAGVVGIIHKDDLPIMMGASFTSIMLIGISLMEYVKHLPPSPLGVLFN
jgi:hypothetical protein